MNLPLQDEPRGSWGQVGKLRLSSNPRHDYCQGGDDHEDRQDCPAQDHDYHQDDDHDTKTDNND